MHSKKQSRVSSIVDGESESEYVRELLAELVQCKVNVKLFNDNQSAVQTAKNGDDFQKNRHYRVKVNYLINALSESWLEIQHRPGDEMKADFLTKPLTEAKLTKLLSQVHIY